MKRLILASALALAPVLGLAAPALGERPPVVVFEGEDGAKVDGNPWSTEELKGKVHVMFYVDPDERTLNDHVAEALKAEKFDRQHYGSVAVINMAATWLPNRLLESSLADKQKEFPDTLYVKDFKKLLVKRWGVADHTSNVLVFDPDGRLVFYRSDKLSDADVQALISVIKANMPH
jgi:Predicted transcriptional regulator